MPIEDIGQRLAFPHSFSELPMFVRKVLEDGVIAVNTLIVETGMPTKPETALAVERGLLASFMAMSDLVYAALVQVAARSQEVREDARAAVVDIESARDYALRDHGTRPVTVQFLGGSEIGLRTGYWAPDYSGCVGRPREKRGASGSGCYPCLDVLGFVDGQTPAVASEVARQATALASFEEARQGLATRELDLDTKTVRRTAEIVGERALRSRDERQRVFDVGLLPKGTEFAGKRVAVMFDGGRTLTREGGRTGRRRKETGRRGFRTVWREPKLMAIYEVDEKGRKKSEKPVYEGTFLTWKGAFRMFVMECWRRGVSDAAQLILAGDGSNHIWDQIGPFVSALGIAPERVHKIVDFYHAAEHVYELAGLCRNWSANKRRAWTARALRDLRAGRIERVITAGEALAVGRRGTKIQKALDYFRERAPFMRYAAFRKLKLPIGTGVIESTIRRVVNLRLKNPGTFWDVENAERMLVLRCYLKSGRWDELERTVLAFAATQRRGFDRRKELREAA
jgi:hypothetical protein